MLLSFYQVDLACKRRKDIVTAIPTNSLWALAVSLIIPSFHLPAAAIKICIPVRSLEMTVRHWFQSMPSVNLCSLLNTGGFLQVKAAELREYFTDNVQEVSGPVIASSSYVVYKLDEFCRNSFHCLMNWSCFWRSGKQITGWFFPPRVGFWWWAAFGRVLSYREIAWRCIEPHQLHYQAGGSLFLQGLISPFVFMHCW